MTEHLMPAPSIESDPVVADPVAADPVAITPPMPDREDVDQESADNPAVPRSTVVPTPSETTSDDAHPAATGANGESSIGEAQPPTPLHGIPAPVDVPKYLFLNDLHTTPLVELAEMAAKCNLRLNHERSRHSVIFELARRLMLHGTRMEAEGILEITRDNVPMLRWQRFNFLPCPEDVAVPFPLVKNRQLRPGQKLRVLVRPPRDVREKNLVVQELLEVEGVSIADWQTPTYFDELTPAHPRSRIMLESHTFKSVSARFVDLIAPLGKGQRGLIVAPPRAGKTILLKELAQAIKAGNPDIRLLILLVDERPEEVTDFRRSIDAEIYCSTFDESPIRHVQVAELVGERAKRLVEVGKDVVILLDSITRLARGYNALQPNKGSRVMSGGVDTKALMKPKRFFGSARNLLEGGSLTVLATALIETESRMDDVIFEEFKGTGNMEIHLDRELVERRVFPAIHIPKSGTRKEELLYHADEFARIGIMRKELLSKPPFEATQELVDALSNTRTNAELLLTGLR